MEHESRTPPVVCDLHSMLASRLLEKHKKIITPVPQANLFQVKLSLCRKIMNVVNTVKISQTEYQVLVK